MIAFVSLSGRSTILYKKEFRFIRIFMRVQYIVVSQPNVIEDSDTRILTGTTPLISTKKADIE
jgi:hypothetical protein